MEERKTARKERELEIAAEVLECVQRPFF